MVKKIGMISVLMKKMGGTNKEENRQLQYNLMSDIMKKMRKYVYNRSS